MPVTSAAFVRFRGTSFQPHPATLAKGILFTDLPYRGEGPSVRHFWLLADSIQLIWSPPGWTDEWRLDLVDITRATSPAGLPEFTVVDMLLDFAVEGSGPTYRAIDLDDLGNALLSGRLNEHEVAYLLKSAQKFLDRRLHSGAPWPPSEVRPFLLPGTPTRG